MAISKKAPTNIWVAAGDGDLERVRELIEKESMSPNAPDPYTYTPMHAAASYGHIEMLEYLISRGGDVNITDSDGDTPIYTVENIETARYLVEKGAVVARINAEGISPINHLAEDFPQVAEYLRAFSSEPTASTTSQSHQESIGSSSSTQSQYVQDVASEQLTSSLLSSIQDLVDQGVDPEQVEEELRRRVGEAVLNGLLGGYAMTTQDTAGVRTATGSERREPPSGSSDREETEGGENKRPRMDE